MQNEQLARSQDVRLAADQTARDHRSARENPREERNKNHGNTLKNILFKMHEEIKDVSIYLDSVDRIFQENEIPEEV